MGKVMSTVRRFVVNFDVEDRAMKYLEKSKTMARAAPKHPGTKAPELDKTTLDTLFSPNRELDRRVDQFRIQSSPVKDGILPEGYDYVKESTRKLPQKTYGEDPRPTLPVDFGFVVPDVIPEGKLTMRQAVNLIKAFQTKQSTIEELAKANHLDEAKVTAIVEHFSLFVVPAKEYWIPQALLKQPEAEDQKLLDEPVEDIKEDEPLGGAAQHDRREALRGLQYE
ncbi:unnamed protein product [Calicophoron daubneyi]|uniref:NADH dehydrogenase [ubiquinone] 1 alpha subcomplex assembly factor 4 n=1 Tax=Calicophoron daubneyi TaxID=300641 RepID=A0AAV2TQS8_CALDB